MPYYFDQPGLRAEIRTDSSNLLPARLIAIAMALGSLLSPGSAGAAEASYRLGYEAEVYREGILPSPFHIVSVGMNYQSLTTDSEVRVDGDFAFSAEKIKVWALRARNFYWSSLPGKPKDPKAQDGGFLPPMKFSLGRKERTWNELDSEWNLSLVQPIDQWDRMRPAQQGLIGAFFDFEGKDSGLHLFASWFMYPENLPNVIIEDGSFQPYHPLAISSTPETITILGQTKPLNYAIEYPPIPDVLLRPSILASFESTPSNPILYRVFYAFKPLNYFNYALKAKLSLDSQEVFISVKPRLLSHQIAGMDLGWKPKGSDFSFGVSGLVDLPSPETLAPDYTYEPAEMSSLISPWIRYASRFFSASASQLIWTGGLGALVNPEVTGGQAAISSHVFYRNATQVKASVSLPFITARTMIAGRWVHEHDLNADWIGGDLIIPIDSSLGRLNLTLGGDMLQTSLTSNPNLGGELLADLRALDRARIGVQVAL